jgi:hypothetical protein
VRGLEFWCGGFDAESGGAGVAPVRKKQVIKL